MMGSMQFKFLNEIHIIKKETDWNHSEYSKLWLYNLHYFDDLNSSKAESRGDWHRDLIAKWINENPTGKGNGWEPYPLSIRIVNWIKWALAGNTVEEEWLDSLAVQTRFLMQKIEWHLLGNHLFANAKALIFAGLYFEGSEAEHWYNTGLKIVENQLPEQVLDDGANFELSTMYHSIFLEDLLDLLNLFKSYSIKRPDCMVDKTSSMLIWFKTMLHPDFEISLFNDAAFDVSPHPLELINYSENLNLGMQAHTKRVTYLEDSGYIRAQSNDCVLFVDVGEIGPDYLPGHAHADTLTFELSLFSERIFVNTGTSVYGVGEDRLKERGTASHNTVVIDNLNSSEVWSGFRVARRARPFDLDIDETMEYVSIIGKHNGYKRISGKPIHKRTWHLTGTELKISDTISGKKNHSIKSYFHIHPDVTIKKTQKYEYILLTKSGQEMMINFESNVVIELVAYDYHPEFGKSIPSTMFVCSIENELPIKIGMRIKW